MNQPIDMSTNQAKKGRLQHIRDATFNALHPDLYSAKILYFLFCIVAPFGLFIIGIIFFWIVFDDFSSFSSYESTLFFALMSMAQITMVPLVAIGIIAVLYVMKQGAIALTNSRIRLSILASSMYVFCVSVLFLIFENQLLHMMGWKENFSPFFISLLLLIPLFVILGMLSVVARVMHWYGAKYGKWRLSDLLIVGVVLVSIGFVTLPMMFVSIPKSVVEGGSVVAGITLVLSILHIPFVSWVLGSALCMHAHALQPITKKEFRDAIVFVATCLLFALIQSMQFLK